MRSALVVPVAVLLAAIGASVFHLLQPSPPKAKAQPVTHVHRMPPAPLRVATYNIHAGVGADSDFNLNRTTDTLRDLRADVIGLQEVDVHWGPRSEWRNEAREIADALDMEVFFAPIYDRNPTVRTPRRKYGLAILSRYPVVYTQNHETTQRRWDQIRVRTGFPEVVLNVEGSLVHFYAVHLDCCDASVRRTQVAEILRVLSRDGRHPQQVLVGDLNAPPDAPKLQPLWDLGGLVDAWRVAGQGPGSTRRGRRIDYIATSQGIDVTRTKVVETHESASDHSPVIADLVLEPMS